MSAPDTEQTALLDMIIVTITKCTRQLKSVLYNQLRLVVIVVVLTREELGIGLFISQLLAKAIPVRGAKLEKPS